MHIFIVIYNQNMINKTSYPAQNSMLLFPNGLFPSLFRIPNYSVSLYFSPNFRMVKQGIGGFRFWFEDHPQNSELFPQKGFELSVSKGKQL